MYENILFPVDESEDSREILRHVGELANWADATVHLLFVADTTRDSVTVVENTVVDALVEEGEDIVEDAGKTLSARGVEYETDVVQGNPAPTIVEYAERYGHDLIVMATHGRTGLSRYLHGSVSEKVVRLASVPVLTARMQPDEQLVFPYENVLIPTDGSAGALRAAKHGLALAESLNATAHVLSVVDDASLGFDIRSAFPEQAHEQAATEAIEELVTEAESFGLSEIVEHLEHGDPVDAILDCIDANDIHVVVLGTTGRRRTERILLGSVAEKTVRSAPVPVLTVGEPE
ncbi:universal stress protein [Haladaptatus sp. YSMS36]|uniref:universal stress protein n=1 Tax=Haladaptatus sp. YSMS36 TaxID=3033384 RepID=UPI0023E821CF|nr:universal stress protein [Haladaptatus sp. YSMS36]